MENAQKQDLTKEANILEMKAKHYTPNVMNAMVLEATERIYKHLNIKDMRVLNMGGGANGGN